MRFAVVMIPAARDDLAEAWLNAKDRNAVTQAADRIEKTLRTRADTVGEPIGSFRRLVDPPLEVMYQILPDGVRVRVHRIELVE
jgi:hypothetical protein